MNHPIPTDPETWLRRKPFANALTEAGLPISEATLASLVTRGNGPPFRINNKVAEYQWGPGLKWRLSRLRYVGVATGALAQEPDQQDAA